MAEPHAGVGLGGWDFMTGNGGQDTFVWRTTAETGVAGAKADVVTDFDRSELDFLVFTPIDADETIAGNQDFTAFIGTGAFTAPGQIGYFTMRPRRRRSAWPACTPWTPAGSCRE